MSDFEVAEDARDYFFRGKNREIVVLDMFTYTCRYFKNSSNRFTLPEYAQASWKRAAIVPLSQERSLFVQVRQSAMTMLEAAQSFFRRKAIRVINVEIQNVEDTYDGAIPVDDDGGLDSGICAEIASKGQTLSYRNDRGNMVELTPDENGRIWPPPCGWKAAQKYYLG